MEMRLWIESTKGEHIKHSNSTYQLVHCSVSRFLLYAPSSWWMHYVYPHPHLHGYPVTPGLLTVGLDSRQLQTSSQIHPVLFEIHLRQMILICWVEEISSLLTSRYFTAGVKIFMCTGFTRKEFYQHFGDKRYPHITSSYSDNHFKCKHILH